MELISTLFLIILGVIVGCFGTLIGIGGGFIIVPLLILIYGFEAKFAVGTSLTIVFLTALSGSFAYIKQRRVDFKIGLFFALLTVPGAILGAYIVNFFNSNLFKAVFSLILIFVSFKLIISKPIEEKYSNIKKTGNLYRRIIDYNGNIYEYSVNLTRGLLINFFIGFISSIFGVGGGIIHVPAMILLLGFPAHVATATSIFISIFTSIIGVLVHASLSNVKFNFAIIIGVGTIVGAQLGALISQKVKEAFIKKLLGLALLTLAIRLLLEVF